MKWRENICDIFAKYRYHRRKPAVKAHLPCVAVPYLLPVGYSSGDSAKGQKGLMWLATG
jgi:hypothetical protein